MPARLATLPIGHALGDGRYQVLSKLGRGSYGSVYLARDTRLGGRQVAIKEQIDPSPESRDLFQREADILASLSHPGLVHVYDSFSSDRSHYLVMDYIEGHDLREIVREAETARRHLPLEQVLDLIMQVTDAVAYLHRRTPPIVHRDIKPANIRVNAEGRAILVDFGIAKVDLKTTTVVMAKAISIGFSPPEQYEGGGGTDTRSDVYALGATLYSLLTLKTPLDGFERFLHHTPLPRPMQFNPVISPALDEIVVKAMSLDRLHRYRDAGEMLQALKALTSPLVASPPSPPGAATPPVASGVKCWRCGHLCRPGARFCPKCGASVGGNTLPAPAASVRCPACGAESRAEARFCKRCGAVLEAHPSLLQEVGRAVQQGAQHMRAGHWALAVDEYERALKLGCADLEAFVNLGECYLKLDRLDDAIDVLETAVQQHQNHAVLHARLADAYLEAGRTIPGIQMLEHAYHLAPDDETLALQLARTCFDAEQLTQAERVLSDWERRRPQQADWPFWLGMLAMKRGQTDRAIKHFRQAIQLAPDRAMAYYFIGEICAEQKKWAEAAGAYQRCAEVDPTDADPWAKLGQCYLALNRPADASAALRRALQIDPEHQLARAFAAQLPDFSLG